MNRAPQGIRIKRTNYFIFLPSRKALFSLLKINLPEMATLTVIRSYLPKVSERPKYRPVFFNPVNSSVRLFLAARSEAESGIPKETIRGLHNNIFKDKKAVVSLIGAGLALTLVGCPAFAGEVPLIQLNEPSNALSLPTWAIHISSVVEWITAMVLVWQYGEKSGNETWKGLSWGMVPLLGGALCACTWHFFYNSEALEVLVALQAGLTVLGNVTLCLAAFRIYGSSSQEQSKKL